VIGTELDAEFARGVFGGRADTGPAWTIVDELQVSGCLVRVATYREDSVPQPRRPEVQVTCWIEQTARGVHRRVAEADAANAPLAIYRAALQVRRDC
jgi:hypothetical protein